MLEDPQLAANDGFLELRNEADGTTRRSINGPVSFSDLPVRPGRAGAAARRAHRRGAGRAGQRRAVDDDGAGQA